MLSKQIIKELIKNEKFLQVLASENLNLIPQFILKENEGDENEG